MTRSAAAVELDRTLLYPESGGQMADRGVVGVGEARLVVDDVQHLDFPGGYFSSPKSALSAWASAALAGMIMASAAPSGA